MSQPQIDIWLNRIIDNRYQIIERIGHGGMGIVYKVVHTQMGKIAAMKLLHSKLAEDKDAIRRFHCEAEAISKLSHPNIIQVFDFGQVENSVYLVMEYLKGEDLGAILKRDGPLSFSRCGRMLMQICDALAEAHDLKIIHRDLKPENVRVCRTKDGQDFLKVLDFGLAKVMEDDAHVGTTDKGRIIGTPYYMSPEMIRTDPLDHRCDIYSLGAMAYRMLTGENAFTAKTPVGVLTKHITEEIVLPSFRAPTQYIPPNVDSIIAKAMAKDPYQRYQSALEMKQAIVEALESLAANQDTAVTPVSERIPEPIPYLQRRESDLFHFSEDRPDLASSWSDDSDEIRSLGINSFLSKGDLAFEKRLRWGRFFKIIFILIILGAMGLLIYWYGLRDGEIYAPTTEIEPNNTPDQATPLFVSKPITGKLGQRLSINESDRDWFRFQIDGHGPQVLRVTAGGIPNMDIALELYDATAGRITSADSASKGGGEIITNWTLDPGTYYVLLREFWRVGVPPTENVTDHYRLEIQYQPYEESWEMEPNDRPEQATLLKAGETVHGYLGAVNDVDIIKVTSTPGVLAGVISGINGENLILEIVANSRNKPLIIDKEGPSSEEHFDHVRTNGKQPVIILIRRKNQQKPHASTTPLGLDTPYTLKVWLN